MACLIVFTIFLNSFSFLMLLRMGWVSYQHDLYLSHTVYFMNSLTWADGISQEEKAHFLDMLFALPEMPELIEIEVDSERFTSASLAQEEWQKQTGQNDLQLDGNWIILNRDEAKAQQLNVKDTIEEAGSIFNIAGIWDQQTIRGLSSIDSLAISSASSFSFRYEEELDQPQNQRLNDLLMTYGDDAFIEPPSLLYDRQQAFLQDFYKKTAGCIGVAMLGCINTLFLVWFWNRRNEQHRRVLALCGCGSGKMEACMFLEIMILTILAWLLSCGMEVLTSPLQDLLLSHYEVRPGLPLSLYCAVGGILVLLQVLLFLPVYAWQEEAA